MLPLLVLIVSYASQLYIGSLLGVRVRVELNERIGVASLTLAGFSFADELSGDAHFKNGNIVLSPKLAHALERRKCSVIGVEKKGANLGIVLQLPFFGRRSISLTHVY